MARGLIGLVGLSVCLWWGQAQSAAVIELKGAYRGGAVLEVDGRLSTLLVGQTSAEGVRLISADPAGAVVEVGGQRFTVDMSRRIATRFAAPEHKRVAVHRDANNQYLVGGAINGVNTRFLVDTGATAVAMSSDTARALGIDYRVPEQRGYAQTAGGLVTSYRVQLRSVSVGEITLHNVTGFVNDGSYPREVLLGMSFLRHVRMSDSAGVLYLEH